MKSAYLFYAICCIGVCQTNGNEEAKIPTTLLPCKDAAFHYPWEEKGRSALRKGLMAQVPMHQVLMCIIWFPPGAPGEVLYVRKVNVDRVELVRLVAPRKANAESTEPQKQSVMLERKKIEGLMIFWHEALGTVSYVDDDVFIIGGDRWRIYAAVPERSGRCGIALPSKVKSLPWYLVESSVVMRKLLTLKKDDHAVIWKEIAELSRDGTLLIKKSSED